MAGDWIKMRQDLHDDPAVILMSVALDLDEDSIVGKLHRLWCWADKHTSDGKAPAITPKWVDRYVSMTGFSDAMVSAGWLYFDDYGITFPNFDRHNGQSAKTRGEATLRKRLSRENRDNGHKGDERMSLPRPFIKYVYQRDNYTCVYCGVTSYEKKEASYQAILSVDHLIPASRGGDQAMPNLACACRICNNQKNDRTPEEWGILPTYLQEGVSYIDGKMSQETCDKGVTREEKRREIKNKTKKEISLKEFLDQCKTNNEKPIVDTDPIFDYVEKTEIPLEFLHIAWRVFKDKFIDSDKLQKDWRATFRNYVKSDYLKVWYFKDGQCLLTTTGIAMQNMIKKAA